MHPFGHKYHKGKSTRRKSTNPPQIGISPIQGIGKSDTKLPSPILTHYDTVVPTDPDTLYQEVEGVRIGGVSFPK
jgi:hypothetical protein